MNSDSISDDDERHNVSNLIRSEVLGQLRLNRMTREEIIEHCVAVYLDEDLTVASRAEFESFIGEEIERVSKRLETEMAEWPAETDCDRLDRVEASLREAGIIFWQASPCCDSCTMAEFPDRLEQVETDFPDFRENLRGYTFFIDQTLPESLEESTHLSVYLSYGWISPDGEGVPQKDYEHNALSIAREVCRHLHDEGFEVDWDGTMARKISVSLNWLRRTPLV